MHLFISAVATGFFFLLVRVYRRRANPKLRIFSSVIAAGLVPFTAAVLIAIPMTLKDGGPEWDTPIKIIIWGLLAASITFMYWLPIGAMTAFLLRRLPARTPAVADTGR